MTKDEALRLALEAFNNLAAWNDGEVGSHINEPYAAEVAREAITTIKAALEAKDEPVAWDGYNLDDMCEAFNRVIEEHFHRKHPFHDPVNNDAMIALRTLRGFIPYMKRHTTPPQRKPLTDEEIKKCWDSAGYTGIIPKGFARAIEAKLKEKNT